MSAGNGTDEYVEREIADTSRLPVYEAEIANGRRRLDQPDYRRIRTVEGRTSDALLIRVVDAGTPMLVHRATRELNPALAAIAAARKVPCQLFLKHLREVSCLFRRLEGLLRSPRNPILPFKLRRRFSCEAMSASSDETADSSADFRAISLSRNLKSEFVLI
jgi:hypothetical protein